MTQYRKKKKKKDHFKVKSMDTLVQHLKKKKNTKISFYTIQQ